MTNNSELFRNAWKLAYSLYDVAKQEGTLGTLTKKDMFRVALNEINKGDTKDIPENPITPVNDLPILPYYDYLSRGQVGYKFTNHNGSATFYNKNRGVGRADDDGLDMGAYLTWADGKDYTAANGIDTFKDIGAITAAGVEYNNDIERFVYADKWDKWIRYGFTAKQALETYGQGLKLKVDE